MTALRTMQDGTLASRRTSCDMHDKHRARYRALEHPRSRPERRRRRAGRERAHLAVRLMSNRSSSAPRYFCSTSLICARARRARHAARALVLPTHAARDRVLPTHAARASSAAEARARRAAGGAGLRVVREGTRCAAPDRPCSGWRSAQGGPRREWRAGKRPPRQSQRPARRAAKKKPPHTRMRAAGLAQRQQRRVASMVH